MRPVKTWMNIIAGGRNTRFRHFQPEEGKVK